MALLNIFKKNKPAPVKDRKERPKKEAVPAKEKPAPSAKPKKASLNAYRLLKAPRITEKATFLTAQNQYVFEVTQNANKTEIKKAVEDIFGVKVTAVRIINIPPKKRRLGRTLGWKGGYKKAIVQLPAGQKIEILPR